MPIEFKEEHLREITENSERSKSNCHRLDEIEEDIKSLQEDNRALYEMSASIKTLTDGVVSIKADVKDIKNDYGEMKTEIQDMKNAPTKAKAQWVDKAIAAVCGAVGMAILSYILSEIAPSIFS